MSLGGCPTGISYDLNILESTRGLFGKGGLGKLHESTVTSSLQNLGPCICHDLSVVLCTYSAVAPAMQRITEADRRGVGRLITCVLGKSLFITSVPLDLLVLWPLCLVNCQYSSKFAGRETNTNELFDKQISGPPIPHSAKPQN